MLNADNNAVVFQNIVKTYRPHFSLDVKYLQLCSNTIYCLQGENGCGKSTLLNIVLDIVLPDSGKIYIYGNRHITDAAKIITASFLDKDRLLDFLTVGEYFSLIGSSYKKNKQEIKRTYDEINTFFDRPYLVENKLIKNYSAGNKQLIGLMAAFIVNAKLIVLDEPLNFLDTNTAAAFCTFLNTWMQTHETTVVFSSNVSTFFDLHSIHFITIQDGKVVEEKNS